MRRLIHMTWQELDALDREKAIIVIPIGSVEQHGPHLPLGTDFLLAEKLVERLLCWEAAQFPWGEYLHAGRLHPELPQGP